ncbi:hypothetical protein BC827DRAFT_1211658 [Russula dissimulans]|nr:hypothetical protein BC827DRAFT_1211658 [Russula dissimulans]
MEAQKPAQPTSSQPQKSIQMDALNPATPANSQQAEHQHKARRIRGGGAGRDCFIGLIECFICFAEPLMANARFSLQDCCECLADIICCPCEMCC